MNESRRDFLKKAGLLSGGAGIWSVLPGSIEKAMAITADPGTTFLDAEHVVLLMQENRSFDHCYGTLKGVRGYNDRRAIQLPDKNPVWLQADKEGNRYAPFRFDIKGTMATWMRDIPHSWENQVDARNHGKYDNWIEAKRSGRAQFRDIPMTMGYYSREDIPFYYAFADAFTVCDQHFCAALAGTTTNRSYFWTGKTHPEGKKAKVRNGELTYGKEVSWNTFPDRLEDNDISWKVYQNEISLPSGVEDSSLLANFTDNNLEWFTQFGARYSLGHYNYLRQRQKQLPKEVKALEKQLKQSGANIEELSAEIAKKNKEISSLKEYLAEWNPERFKKLSAREQSMHHKAFTTNSGDPNYHKVETMTYEEQGEERSTSIPKGDVLYQFRKDVKEGNLPAVSWVVAPQKFSDHPSAPWYGAWYVSEVLDILTQNPEVWKKTIFILNYDENDGYFDHIPPFVAPDPRDADQGKASEGLDVTGEIVTKEEEIKEGFSEKDSRTSPVGLGYRVPLVVASPWSRGGWVNSEVCDITSTIMLMEKWLSHKTGKEIKETNISDWRREISGDLSSVFRPYNGEEIELPEWVKQKEHVQQIYNAKFKGLPTNYKALTPAEAQQIAQNPQRSELLPTQEPGTKPSNALPYELYVDGAVSSDGENFTITFAASKEIFGEEALGAPFNVYTPGNYLNPKTGEYEAVKTWAFAVKSGDSISYQWPIASFENGQYHLRVYGPNGYFREFEGSVQGPRIHIEAKPIKQKREYTDKIKLTLSNSSALQGVSLKLVDEVYQKDEKTLHLGGGESASFTLDTQPYGGWYEFKVLSEGIAGFGITYAGRLETGKDRVSDPAMGVL